MYQSQFPWFNLEWQVEGCRVWQISPANLLQHPPGTSQYPFSLTICLKVMLQAGDSSDKVPVHDFLKFRPTVRNDSIWQATCWKYLWFQKGKSESVWEHLELFSKRISVWRVECNSNWSLTRVLLKQHCSLHHTFYISQSRGGFTHP